MVSTIYSYWGYYNICHLGSEIKDPEKISPRHFSFRAGDRGAVSGDANKPLGRGAWREAQNSDFIASLFVERLYGQAAARFVTGMILWIAVASAFSVLARCIACSVFRGSGREFLPRVGRYIHETLSAYLPAVLAGLAFLFSISLKLKQAIAGILAMRLLVQFIGQAVGVMLLRRRRGTQGLPSRCAVSAACGADDDRMGLSFGRPAHAKVGIGGNRPGSFGVSDSRAGSETMAFWKSQSTVSDSQ